jgi:hypothetical protein
MTDYIPGILASGSNLIYTCPAGEIKLVGFRFTNPAAYTLKVVIYDSSALANVTLYDLTLDGDDVVVDDGNYKLNENDTITVTSVPANTEYLLYTVTSPL